MRTKLPDAFVRVFVMVIAVTLTACGGGGGGSGGAAGSDEPATGSNGAPAATADIGFVGNAVKSAVNNAEIVLVYFDEDGREVEIQASNAPVMTGPNGRFVFQAPLYDLPRNLGPGILRTEGGTTGPDGGLAPRLETVIPDISAVSNSTNPLSHMTAASSVAATLLRTEARTMGARPTVDLANAILDRVETQLLVDLSQDPTLATTAVAQFNQSFDALLSLRESSLNNSSVNELVSYLAANLSSSSLQLDDMMQNPTNPGLDVAASLRVFGSGALSTLFPVGPEQLLYMRIESDRARIANDGFELATLAVSIRNLLGATIPASSAEAVEFTIIEGQGSLTQASLTAANNQITVGLTSIAAGVVLVEASYTMPSGLLLTQILEIEVLDEVVDAIGPTIISAVATSNTEVIVTFSEALRGGITGAENPLFYTITATDGTGQSITSSSVVGVVSATLIAPDNSSVRLVTQSQSDADYILQTTNLRDVAGNTFLAPNNGFGVVNPSATIFVGRAPTGSDIVDTDNDGLSDSDELRGWTVSVTSATGEITSYSVTSDPENADTDGDGVNDNEEKHGALNPRTADTDGDTITDYDEWNTVFSDGTHQDTDGDGVQDGFEYYTFRTSPILADTDGDQISDPDEVSAGNRNPLIADLPSPRIIVDNISLSLDTRYDITNVDTEEAFDTKTTEATLTSAEDKRFASSNEQSTKSTLEFSQEIGVKYSKGPKGTSASIAAKVGSKQGSEQGNTFTTSKESGRSSEEAFHDSLTTSRVRSSSEAITRRVDGATMRVSVSIDSQNDIPFSISNLELTAETQNPSNRRQMVPVASLVPQNEGLDAINIGTLGDISRGPFVFEAVDIFPQQVEELMKNPRGLIVSLANFDITDEFGRNFAFTSRDVLDRTAGITFDMGDGRVETYRVATASKHDPASGRPEGIPLSYALSIIGLQRYEHIVDGGNGILDSTRAGDDLALTIPGKPGDTVETGRVLITAGKNGILETSADGDDRVVAPDYETTEQESFSFIRDGGNGIVETEADAQDRQVIGHATSLGNFTNRTEPRSTIVTEDGDGLLSTLPNHLAEGVPVGDDKVETNLARRLLTRFREVEGNGLESRFWVLVSPFDRQGVDMDNIVIRAGEEYNFVYVQDRDGDEVFAREEYLHGSSDFQSNTDSCTSGNEKDSTTEAYWSRTDNCDYLNDKQEISLGWRVNLRDTLKAYQAYPNPNQGDSDRDGLFDDQEKLCGTDPRQRDTDLDGLSDWEEITGRLIDLGDGGANNDNMVSRDPDTRSIKTRVDVYAGSEYVSDKGTVETGDDTVLAPHDVMEGCLSLHSTEDGIVLSAGFATDPLKADTDGDMVSDGRELRLGLDPNDNRDGADFLDDDDDGVPNSLELRGYDAWINGRPVRFTSSPFNSDSDGDGLPDLLERLLGSNPSSVLPELANDGGSVGGCIATDFAFCENSTGEDTDNDGITDFNEYAIGGLACVTIPGNSVCEPFTTNGWQTFLVDCEAAPACNLADINDTLAARGALNHGTSLSHEDSDGDNLTDKQEIDGFSIDIVPGGTVDVFSNPLFVNSDSDGWDDFREYRVSNPGKADTDGDLKNDDEEAGLFRDPLVRDRRITITLKDIGWTNTDCDSGSNEDWFYSLGYQRNGGARVNMLSRTRNDYLDKDTDFDNEVTLAPTAVELSFTAAYGEQFSLSGFVAEADNDVSPTAEGGRFTLPTANNTVDENLPLGTNPLNKTSGPICGGSITVYADSKVE